MEVAALVVWIITAAGGFVLLGTWIAKGGHRPGGGFALLSRWLPQVRGRTGYATGDTTPTAEAQFPVPVVVLHGLLAATTLVLVLLAALSG